MDKAFVRAIRLELDRDHQTTMGDVASSFGCSRSLISLIAKGEIYKDVNPPRCERKFSRGRPRGQYEYTHKLGKAQKERVLEMRKQGKSYRTIAKAMGGVSHQTISNYLKAM